MLILLLLLSAPQEPKAEKPWSVEWRVRGELSYSSNVWLLDDDQIDRLEDDLPGDEVSGRFDDMESVDDVILAPSVRFATKGPSFLGRRLELRAGLETPVYFENGRKSHLRAELGAEQTVGARGRLEFGLAFLPEYFRKNYLSDATDFTGDVSASERRYEEGIYRETELFFEYRHGLVEREGDARLGLDALASVGYRDRMFDAPFAGRDERGPSAGLGLRLEYGPSIRATVRYRFEDVDSPTRAEVLILDETLIGIPLNSDADAADTDARSVQDVDRSHAEHRIALTAEIEAAPGLEVEFAYVYQIRDYRSDEPFDVNHRGREDTRHEIGLAFRYALAKDWTARLGYDWREQETDRPDDPGASGETLDYARHVVFASVAFRW